MAAAAAASVADTVGVPRVFLRTRQLLLSKNTCGYFHYSQTPEYYSSEASNEATFWLNYPNVWYIILSTDSYILHSIILRLLDGDFRHDLYHVSQEICVERVA